MTSLFWLSLAAVLTSVIMFGPVSLLSAMNACNGHGYTEIWSDSCTCTGPWSGKSCDQCTCMNNGRCSNMPGKGPECVCDSKQQWSGELCEVCDGFCTRYDLDYVLDNTTDFTQVPCIGRCLLPCNANLNMYINTDTQKCEKCVESTTCSGHGTCKTSGGTTGNMCSCTDQYWTDSVARTDRSECSKKCQEDVGGCMHGSTCNRETNDGTCTAVLDQDKKPLYVGPSAQFKCKACVHGLCHYDERQTSVSHTTCQCDFGFRGELCDIKCPRTHNNRVVCGTGSGDTCNDAGRCVCNGRELASGHTCDCVCGPHAEPNCALDPTSDTFQCVCPASGRWNDDCSACQIGYGGINCDIECSEETCNDMGYCQISQDDVPLCTCNQLNLDSTIRNIVLEIDRDTTSAIRSNVTISETLANTHVIFHNTAVFGSTLQKYTVLKAACGFADKCVVNPFDGTATNEIDGMVPLPHVESASGACTVTAGETDNLFLECTNNPRCHAFSETAGMLFHQISNCDDTNADTDALNAACAGNADLRACQYASVAIVDHFAASMLQSFDALPTPAPPTPFPTPAIIPGEIPIPITLPQTDLTSNERVNLCNAACRDMSNATLDVEASGTEPTTSTRHNVVYTRCLCVGRALTPQPTPVPTPAPTASPTHAPSPQPGVMQAMGFGSSGVTRVARPNAPLVAEVPLEEAVLLARSVAQRPQLRTAILLFNRNTASKTLSLRVTNASSGSSVLSDVQQQLHGYPVRADLDSNGRLRMQQFYDATQPPIDTFVVLRKQLRLPKIKNDTGLYVDTTREMTVGCGECKPNFYPSPRATDAGNVEVCSRYCTDDETCHGRGRCNEQGKCDCYDENSQFADDFCTTCRPNYFPEPASANKDVTKRLKTGWCTSFCNDEFSESRARLQPMTSPSAWSIGCSGHGFCENGVLDPDRFEPNVRCECAPGYGGRYCASSCYRTEQDKADQLQCSGHGACTAADGNSHSCKCETGFFGAWCEIGCTGMPENAVAYADNTTDYCNARDTTRGGVCALSADYRVPDARNIQLHEQQCWLAGPVSGQSLVPGAAAAAECCGLPADINASSTLYRSTCSEEMRVRMGIFCDSDDVLKRGTCRRASCDCVGQLGGTNCFLDGCPQVVVGAKFSHCGEKNGVGECARGYCVPSDDVGAPTLVNATPGTASRPGHCACQRQPSTDGQCASTDSEAYTQRCCNAPDMNNFHGPGCSKACGCSNAAKGTCSNERDATGVCSCRRTFPDRRALFCGPTCSGNCPGVQSNAASLEKLCPSPKLSDTASSAACYNDSAAVDVELGQACSGHGTCSEQNCRCVCDGTDTNVVAGAVYPQSYLYQGEACQFQCPGTSDIAELDALLRQVDAPNAGTTVEVARALERYADAYAEKACSGHGYCAQDSQATSGHCTCHGGYTGHDCSQRGCFTGSNTEHMDALAVAELDEFGLQTCSGHGTCVPNQQSCQCEDNWALGGTIFAELTSDLQQQLAPYRHALTQQCGLCANGRFTASATAATTAVASENVPPAVMYLLGRRNCGEVLPDAGAGAFPMCCAENAFQDDLRAMLVGGGCQVNGCATHAAQGKKCETCRFGFQDRPSAASCADRCAVCGAPLALHHLGAAQFQRSADQVGDASTDAMRLLGCRPCEDGAMAPELRHGARSGVCSGRGRCAGAPSSWAAGMADAARNVDGTGLAHEVGTCRCDDGATGFTCALSSKADACRTEDAAAELLPNGMCRCSNYQRYAPPYCLEYGFTGNAYVVGDEPLDDDETPQMVTPPLFRPASGGNNVACYGRGQLRVQTKQCQTRKPGSPLCRREPTQATALYPCSCDEGWDESTNCLERTQAHAQQRRAVRCACAKIADPSTACEAPNGARCDLEA